MGEKERNLQNIRHSIGLNVQEINQEMFNKNVIVQEKKGPTHFSIFTGCGSQIFSLPQSGGYRWVISNCG